MEDMPPILRQNKILILVIFVTILFIIILTIFQEFDGLQRINNIDNDYTKLINITFSFVSLPLICQLGKHNFVVLVHSAPSNKAKRTTIRDTWGHRENRIKVLFMLGDVQDKADREALANEFEIYGDLVQGSFLDSYHNLTYKHVMLLKYAVYHCPEVEYVVKVDDDVFINVPNLKKFIHLYRMIYHNSNNILCSRMDGSPVLRSGKWGVPVAEYPKKTYPKYCSGFAVIYPRSAVHALYSQAQKTEYFWIDDVHVTGTLAAATNIMHTGIEQLIVYEQEIIGIVDFNFTNTTKPFLFGGMNVNGHQISSLWDFIQHHIPKVSILDYLE